MIKRFILIIPVQYSPTRHERCPMPYIPLQLRFILKTMLLSVLLMTFTTSPILAEPSESEPVSSETLATIRKLKFDYKRHHTDKEKKDEILDQLTALGEQGRSAALNLVLRELDTPLRAYMKRYAALAEFDVTSRYKANAGKIEELRATIMGLRKDANLIKATIKATADPALAEIESILVPTQDEILFADPTMIGYRGAVMSKAIKWSKITGEKPNVLLARYEQLAIMQALLPEQNHKKVIADNLKLGLELDDEEARGIEELNRIRILIGLNPQKIDLKLCDAARDHSKDMHEKKFFSHTSPVPGKKSPWQRAKRFGTSANAENIAAGTGKGLKAIKMWWYSPGHFKNMIGKQKRTALGRHRSHWTQLFG